MKTAILGACAPGARLDMLSLDEAEKLEPDEVQRFSRKVERVLAGWK